MTEELNILGKTLKISSSGGGALSNTPSVDLGQVSSASFETNKNYTASISGSVSFTLPIPTDTTIENKIIINLNILNTSIINWNFNINGTLSNFLSGKYEIRLLWNNISSAWTAEVLKGIDASSPVKLLIRFNGSIVDESSSPITLAPSRTLTEFPVYDEGQYGQQKLTCTNNSNDNYVIPSGDTLSKLNLGTGDFTIKCWVKAVTTTQYPIDIFYTNNNKKISASCQAITIFSGDKYLNANISGVSSGDIIHVAFTRQNGVIYYFVNGNLIKQEPYTGNLDFSDCTKIFACKGLAGGTYFSIQELIVKNTCDYTTNFTLPSSPFVLNDTNISDLHDKEKEDVSNKTSDYTLNGENTYPNSKALSDAVSYLEGLISDVTPPTPDYTNAIEFNKAANVNYTCPSAGWIQIRAATFTASDNSAGYAKISINGNDIRSYYVSNSTSTTYNWSNNSDGNFSGETLIQVAEGDTVKFYAEGFTMSNATFEGTFIPQQSA